MTPMFVAPDEPPNPALILPVLATGLLYFVALALLVLQLVLPSRTLDDTAHGDAPPRRRAWGRGEMLDGSSRQSVRVPS